MMIKKEGFLKIVKFWVPREGFIVIGGGNIMIDSFYSVLRRIGNIWRRRGNINVILKNALFYLFYL